MHRQTFTVRPHTIRPTGVLLQEILASSRERLRLVINRILLSSALAGEKAADDISLNSLEWYKQNQIELRLGARITDINADEKTVTGDDGSVTPFDKLLLCEKKRQ